MCSCEGKQIQLLLENSSRQCQKPTSCIFARNPHAPHFPSGGVHWRDFRHHGMGWEETFEDSGAEPFPWLLEAWRWAGLSIPCHQLNLSALALGLPQALALWGHRLMVQQPWNWFDLAQPLPGGPASSCTKSAGMPLGNIS